LTKYIAIGKPTKIDLSIVILGVTTKIVVTKKNFILKL